ncbi:MAG TPA: gas vesicle protein GvpO [Yaniella sp.]
MTEQQEANDETKKTRQSTRTRRTSSSDSDAATTKQRPQSKRTSSRSSESSKSTQEAPKRRAKPKISGSKATLAALKQLQLLTTRVPESVIGLEAREDGWRVRIEVVESARIPNTADIMAEYEVDIDGDGDLTGYSRKSRYSRGRTSQED